MKDTPLLMKGPLVRATLEDLKRVTRRLYKAHRQEPYEIIDERDDGCPWPFWMDECGDYHERPCPYGNPGDQLWVRETFAGDDLCGFVYQADHPDADIKAGELDDGEQTIRSWRPSIYMPRAACRLVLRVESVRLERLQDITEEDAHLEGVTAFDGQLSDVALCARAKAMGQCAEDARVWFAVLWDQINPKHPWDSNPWVWRVEFRRLGGER